MSREAEQEPRDPHRADRPQDKGQLLKRASSKGKTEGRGEYSRPFSCPNCAEVLGNNVQHPWISRCWRECCLSSPRSFWQKGSSTRVGRRAGRASFRGSSADHIGRRLHRAVHHQHRGQEHRPRHNPETRHPAYRGVGRTIEAPTANSGGRSYEPLAELLASRGLSNQQIESRVHLAEGIVKRHLANIYQKMGVGSRFEAARKALQAGVDHHNRHHRRRRN